MGKSLEKIIHQKELELLKTKDRIRYLQKTITQEEKKTQNKIHLVEKKLNQKNQELINLKYRHKDLEERLNATLDSKTWKLGQLYGKIIGVSSPLQRLLKPFTLKLSKKKSIPIINSLKTTNDLKKSTDSIVHLPTGALEGNTYDLFIFPMINFSFRYQRPQQLASYFARRGHRVFYLNITEFLLFNSREEFRIKKINKNLYEVFLKSPSRLNIYSGKLSKNTLACLYSSINSLSKHYGIITAVCLVHNPFWYPLVFKIKSLYGWKVVYDCLDDWDSDMFKGIGPSLIEEEKKLVNNADLLTVTAELLFNKWHKDNSTCTIVRNACDYGHFSKASFNSLLTNIKKPIIGFFGGIADWIDIDTIKYAALKRKDLSFVLIGGIFTDVSSIKKLPNVHLLGNKPYENMPSYLINFNVCLIPFKKNKITEAVDPVKLYEYFSLGKPVVARDLYEIRNYKENLYLFNTQEEFVRCIEMALNENNPVIRERRKNIAALNTWDTRVDLMHNKIKNHYEKVSIIIVTYNNIQLNKLCIESILNKTDYPNYEIIVVDNNSTDGTADYLKSLQSKFDFIKAIHNTKNEGFAKANNFGVKVSKGDYIVFLNNDTVVTKSWLTKFTSYLNRYREIGLIGPVTNFCGNEAKIETSYEELRDMDVFAYNRSLLYEGKFFEIKMLALYCVAMRRETIEKVGLLDERFGIGLFEDDDYSHRVKHKDYKIVCAEDIFIHHFGQASFNKLIKNGKYREIWKQNQQLFEEKWGVKWETHKHKIRHDSFHGKA
jgi:GT2 family glycosyltransferase